MTTEAQPLAEITQTAIRLLCEEMGVVNTVRFLNQFTTGYGNYTEERDSLYDALTVADIAAEIRKLPVNAHQTAGRGTAEPSGGT